MMLYWESKMKSQRRMSLSRQLVCNSISHLNKNTYSEFQVVPFNASVSLQNFLLPYNDTYFLFYLGFLAFSATVAMDYSVFVLYRIREVVYVFDEIRLTSFLYIII